jgi:hypothetical protein
MRHPTTPILLAVVLVAVGFIPEATAFKRTQTCDSTGTLACDPGEEPKPIEWPIRCIHYRINEQGSDDFPADPGSDFSSELRQIVRDSFGVWNDVNCSDFQMVDNGLTFVDDAEYLQSSPDENQNVIVWKDDRWPYQNTGAFAITSVTFNPRTGIIADADIEVNSDTWTYAHLDSSQTGNSSMTVDLQNTLTHEVGHFLGLDHPPNASEATMFGTAPAGEIKKRSLEQDDIDGICAIYEAGSPPAACDDPSDFELPSVFGGGNNGGNNGGGGCASADGSPASWVWLLVGIGLWARRWGHG